MRKQRIGEKFKFRNWEKNFQYAEGVERRVMRELKRGRSAELYVVNHYLNSEREFSKV